MLLSVYYRLYDPEGPVAPIAPIDADPSLGCTLIISIPPPYTVASIKRHIVAREGRKGNPPELFSRLSNLSPCQDSDGVDLTTTGRSPSDPIAIVFKFSAATASELEFEFMDERWREFKVTFEEERVCFSRSFWLVGNAEIYPADQSNSTLTWSHPNRGFVRSRES
jgi:hypothetical protein